MKAIIIDKPGGPEVLTYRETPSVKPGKREVLVKVTAAGVNFMDIGTRQGNLWKDTEYPQTLGVEGAGYVLQVGEHVSDFSIGQRVSWAYAPGSYAEEVVVPEDALVAIPDVVDDYTAASIMMQGLTASHFATDFYPIQPGDIALVHAAAGGLGLLLTQIIKLRGGKVIGRVSSKDKVAHAIEAGADHVIVDSTGSFSDEVRKLTNGTGVNVVYDGSGPATFQASIDSLGVSGTFCWYGPVLGAPAPLEIMSLPKSIKIGYAVYSHHVNTPELLRKHTAQLFDWYISGKLNIKSGGHYQLSDANLAHSDMESRKSSGKLLLIP
ncbi:quinone oxidoreductase [Vibrio fluvialis]|nr:quinone oxidoreductase [Vibrio fluvialis]